MSSPKDVILNWIKAFNERDASAAAALYDDNAENIQVAIGTPLVGKTAIEKDLKAFFAAIPDNVTELQNILQDGDQVSIEWIGRGTFYKDPSATGQKFEFRGCGFFRVRGGKIVFQRGYWDKATWFKQVGLPLT